MGQIYAITGSGLKEVAPVNFASFKTGNIIKCQSSRYTDECVIYRIAGGTEPLAIDLKSLRALTIYDLQYLEPTLTGETMPDSEARRYYELACAFKLHAQEEAKKAADYKANETVRLTDALMVKYPWAKVACKTMSDYARAAKNMKKELALAFPGVKFEVRSKSYSGGNSVDISWTDGPAFADVEAITNKYQYGDFNGMEDIYEYDNSAMSQAVAIVLGQAKYVCTSRSISDPVRDAVTDAVCASHKIDGKGVNAKVGSIWLSDYVYRVARNSTIPAQWSTVTIDYSAGYEGKAIFN